MTPITKVRAADVGQTTVFLQSQQIIWEKSEDKRRARKETAARAAFPAEPNL